MASPPFPLTATSSSFKLNRPDLNISFRFGVEQGAKLRACDDLRHSATNLARVVETTIELVIWDRLAEISNLVNTMGRVWSFFKADHEADYKQLPMGASHSSLAVIPLMSPRGNPRYGFIIRAMMFGAVAALLRYNVFPRLISELSTQIFGVPLLVFFDDFGPIAPAEIADSALGTFALFLPKLGIKLKTENPNMVVESLSSALGDISLVPPTATPYQ